jgi:hypothetical protein
LFLPTSAFRFHLFLLAGSSRSYAFDHGILVFLINFTLVIYQPIRKAVPLGNSFSPTNRNAGHHLQPAPVGNNNPRKPLYKNDLTNNPLFSDKTPKA